MAHACLEMAEELATVARRNMIAVHFGVDPAFLRNVSAEEADLQFYRELREGTARERTEVIEAEFKRWKRASPERNRILWSDCPGEISECMRGISQGIELITLSHSENLDGRDALHYALFHSRKLVGVAPRGSHQQKVLDHIVVGWKPHDNAYSTVTAAKSWLQAAGKVSVICVNDHADRNYERTATQLFQSLTIPCEIRTVTSEQMSVGQCLLDQAEAMDASCLMIGAYHHGPLLELVLGRVTRHVLSHASLPLIMKH
jgi:nucleotide-binding universal stress UspA family protein